MDSLSLPYDIVSYTFANAGSNAAPRVKIAAIRDMIRFCSASKAYYRNLLNDEYWKLFASTLGLDTAQNSNPTDWKSLVQRNFRQLNNWINDVFGFDHAVYPFKIGQRINMTKKGVEVWQLNSSEKKLSKHMLDAPQSKEIMSLSSIVTSGSKLTKYLVLSDDDSLIGITDDTSCLSIVHWPGKKLVCRLKDLGNIVEIKIYKSFLFVLVEENSEKWKLLRYDLDQVLEDNPEKKLKPLELDIHIATKQIKKMFINDEYITVLTESGENRSLNIGLIQPLEDTLMFKNTESPWLVSQSFRRQDRVVCNDQGFIICKHRNMGICLQRLEITDQSLKILEEKTDIYMGSERASLYDVTCQGDKLFVSWFCYNSNKLFEAIYDMKTHHTTTKFILPHGQKIVGELSGFCACIFRNTYEKVSFVYIRTNFGYQRARGDQSLVIAEMNYRPK